MMPFEHPSERAERLRALHSYLRPGSIEEAEAIEEIDIERRRREREDERTTQRRQRHWDDD